MTRLEEVFRTNPPVTLGIVFLCSFLHTARYIFEVPLESFTMCPRLVVGLGQYYRIITSALFHGSILHIGMNMIAVVGVAGAIEKRMGTLRTFVVTLWSMILTNILYLIIAFALFALHYDHLWYQHSVGFSGVLFHMSVLECHLSAELSRNFFGFITVPAALYPWILLLALQMFMPGLSFTGHLSGVLVGTLHVSGLLNCLLPSNASLREIETSWPLLSKWANHSNFVQTPVEENFRSTTPMRLLMGATIAVRYLGFLAETIKVMLIGRGQWRSNSAVVEDDRDYWNGLPEGKALATTQIV